MYSRHLIAPEGVSFFLFGPRGVGKSSWLRSEFPDAIRVDLLDSEVYRTLAARPERLTEIIPKRFKGTVILDEVQRIPDLLNEVHRLIEERGVRFALSGSSARKLKRSQANLLAGRAQTLAMFPLTAAELGRAFNVRKSLTIGHLPLAYARRDPIKFLSDYIGTYLREEVYQEGLVRNLETFTRFLETVSFSQAQPINASEVARDAAVERKTVENHLVVLEDLLLATRLPVFSKRAKRKLLEHRKFFFFDVGVYRTLRPKGPLDNPEEIDGPSLETLVFQELRANNHYLNLGYSIYFWRTSSGEEVDFVLYGERGLIAIEVKRANLLRSRDFDSLNEFRADYPMAKCIVIYGGTRRTTTNGIEVWPIGPALSRIQEWLK